MAYSRTYLTYRPDYLVYDHAANYRSPIRDRYILGNYRSNSQDHAEHEYLLKRNNYLNGYILDDIHKLASNYEQRQRYLDYLYLHRSPTWKYSHYYASPDSGIRKSYSYLPGNVESPLYEKYREGGQTEASTKVSPVKSDIKTQANLETRPYVESSAIPYDKYGSKTDAKPETRPYAGSDVKANDRLGSKPYDRTIYDRENDTKYSPLIPNRPPDAVTYSFDPLRYNYSSPNIHRVNPNEIGYDDRYTNPKAEEERDPNFASPGEPFSSRVFPGKYAYPPYAPYLPSGKEFPDYIDVSPQRGSPDRRSLRYFPEVPPVSFPLTQPEGKPSEPIKTYKEASKQNEDPKNIDKQLINVLSKPSSNQPPEAFEKAKTQFDDGTRIPSNSEMPTFKRTKIKTKRKPKPKKKTRTVQRVPVDIRPVNV